MIFFVKKKNEIMINNIAKQITVQLCDYCNYGCF